MERISAHVLNVCRKYEKLVVLSFIEGQPIIELVLNIMLSLPQNLMKEDPMLAEYVVYLAEKCLISLFQN